MAERLRCEDRWRRTIVLPEENWSNKITIDHQELIGNDVCVERVLVDPDIVAFDAIHSDREIFYAWDVLPPPYHRGYLKVCVAFSRTAEAAIIGRIITAYFVDRLKPGEKIRWRRQPSSRRPR